MRMRAITLVGGGVRAVRARVALACARARYTLPVMARARSVYLEIAVSARESKFIDPPVPSIRACASRLSHGYAVVREN